MSILKKVFVFIILVPVISWAQDPIFTQFFNMPEALNPAFTASANTWNAGLLHRRQWPNENRRIDTQFAFVSNLATDELGLGLTIQNHSEVFTGYNYLKVNGAASYRVDINYDWHLRLGIEAGYGQKDFGFGGLLLEDQISVTTGEVTGPSVDPGSMFYNNSIKFYDITAGVLLDNESTWIGASLRHLNRPDISFIESGNVALDMFLSVHGGYYIDLEGLPSFVFPEGSTILLMGNYMRQAQYNRFDLGGVMDYGRFSLGAFTAVNLERKDDNSHILSSVNPVATFTSGEFVFGYSFDINTSRIGRTGGVHELTLVWQSSRDCSKCDNYKVHLKRNGVAGYTR
jgi:type IX secretion system PorP/SprF family membrane protein